MGKVTQLCYMIDALYPAEEESESTAKKLDESSSLHRRSTFVLSQVDTAWTDESAVKNEIMEAVYIQSCYYSLGATLEIESRPAFDDYMKKISGLMMIEDTVQKPATTRTYLIFLIIYIYI